MLNRDFTYVLTHDDLDGVTAGYLAQKYFAPKAEVIFSSYEKLPEYLKQFQKERILITDLSVQNPEDFPPHAFLIDHHRSTQRIAKLFPDRTFFREDMSATKLVHELAKNIYPERKEELKEEQEFVDIVSKRDLWIKPKPGFLFVGILDYLGQKEFFELLKKTGLDAKKIREHAKETIDLLHLKYEFELTRALEHAESFVSPVGIVTIIDAGELNFVSDIAHEILSSKKAHVVVFLLPPALQYQAGGDWATRISLRGTVPVLPFAEALGGGGHPYAAGAVTKLKKEDIVQIIQETAERLHI
ncbi:MAG: hypothetical protein KM296_00040 [Brockia lithotrophica]|nr:hypothetical protein [Brockia lithotrophica]